MNFKNTAMALLWKYRRYRGGAGAWKHPEHRPSLAVLDGVAYATSRRSRGNGSIPGTRSAIGQGVVWSWIAGTPVCNQVVKA